MRKKRSVTLIELFIGCALLAVLLAFVFGLMREIKGGEKLIQKERVELSARVHLEGRLDQLLLKVLPLQKENPGFYTDGENGLIFTSQLGASFDAPFLGRVLCRIYRSPEGNLTLDKWPDPVRHGVAPDEMRREILLPKVEAMSWSFYTPPVADLKVQRRRIGIGVDEEEQEPPAGEWTAVWRVGYKKIPPLLRMNFIKDGKSYVYETYLPSTSFPLEISE